MVGIWLRLRAFVRRRQLDRDLEDELRFHLELREQENRQAGAPADEARCAARRRFGNMTYLKESTREVWGFRSLEILWQDLRYGWRVLRRNPGFTAVAVVSLALGIGANTAIFSLIDALMLRSLPVKTPEQLYHIVHAGRQGISEATNFPLFEHIRDHNQSFSGVIAFNPNHWKVTVDGETEQVHGQLVTGDYYSVLGVNAILGRTLTPDDNRVAGGHPVVVISHAYWRRRFGENPGVLDKTISIHQIPFTIIGVTPPEFFGLQVGRWADITAPMGMHGLVGSGVSLSNRRGWTTALGIIGRVKPGVSAGQARSEVDVLFRQFMESTAVPAAWPQRQQDYFERGEVAPARNGLSALRKQFSYPLQILMGIVGLVLLIACGNVANLLLARARARERELAVRLAIGAGRWRLMRQLLTESILLAALGGAAGLLFAHWGTHFLVSFLPQHGVPYTLEIGPDARVLAFTAALALLTGILFGLAPALQGSRFGLNRWPSVSAREGVFASRILVVGQVALSLVLLTGAGLFARSLQNLRNIDAGFSRENTLLFTVDCYGTRYSGARLPSLYQEILERVSILPGVRSATVSSLTPISAAWETHSLRVPGFAHQRGVDDYVRLNHVGPNYLETVGIPLRAGRSLGGQDTETSPKVAVVSESMARYYFPNENPVGRRFDFSWGEDSRGEIEIVGVARDVKFDSLRTEILRMVYLPYRQRPPKPSMTFALRTAGHPAALANAVRREVQQIGKDVPVVGVRTLAAQVDESLVQERLIATLSGFFGVLALLLACVGLYGVLSYAVARRTQEIGVRMALGAQQGQVLWLVLRETLLLAGIGVGIGLPAALASTGLIEKFLFGLKPTDPATVAAATVVLLGVAATAGYLPARQAARVDPMVALRYQ